MNKRVLFIRTKTGISIKIPLNNKVTIITGDSATGKTKMVRCLSDILSDTHMIEEATINIERLIICENKKDIAELLKEDRSGYIVVIDRYDSVEDIEKLVDFIMRNKCLFVLMAHKEVPQCGYNYSSILGLKHDGINYDAYQMFNTPADYIANTNILI